MKYRDNSIPLDGAVPAKYIDANKLLDEAHRLSGPHTGDGWSNWGVYSLIERQPAADVAPIRRGHWYWRGGRPCCSECNTKALWKDEGGTKGFSHEFVGAQSKWCPECGAMMEYTDEI